MRKTRQVSRRRARKAEFDFRGGERGKYARQYAAMPRHNFIVRDPNMCGGQPVIRGTRVTLRIVLASLAGGDRVDDILRDFPTLTRADIDAVIAFAAAAAQDDMPTPGVPV